MKNIIPLEANTNQCETQDRTHDMEWGKIHVLWCGQNYKHLPPLGAMLS